MLQRIRVVWVYYYIPMFFYYIWLDASFSLPYELRDYPRLPGLSSSLLRISMSIVGSAIGWTFYAYHKIWAHVSKLIFNQVFRPMRKPILQTHYFFSTLHHSHPDHTYQSFQARVWSPLERYILSDELCSVFQLYVGCESTKTQGERVVLPITAAWTRLLESVVFSEFHKAWLVRARCLPYIRPLCVKFCFPISCARACTVASEVSTEAQSFCWLQIIHPNSSVSFGFQ